MNKLLLVLTLFLGSATGEPQAVCPDPVIFVEEGDNVTLRCHVDPSVDLSGYTVDWKTDAKNVVYSYRHQQVDSRSQMNRYKGRVSLSLEDLHRGNLTLQLLSSQLTDNATYKCNVPNLGTSCTVQLTVTKGAGNRIKRHHLGTTMTPHVKETDPPGSGGAETKWWMYVIPAVIAAVIAAVIIAAVIIGWKHLGICKRLRRGKDQPNAYEMSRLNGSQQTDGHEDASGSIV